MPDVYESCPVFENGAYLLRLIREEDAGDLLAVYSDKNALPFFNSDNCHGDNFYYPTAARMKEAVDFWVEAYRNRWFVRFAIQEKSSAKVIGTVELCRREAEDGFNGVGILRLDVGSGHEQAEVLSGILSLIAPHAFELVGCEKVVTKAPIYAVERL